MRSKWFYCFLSGALAATIFAAGCRSAVRYVDEPLSAAVRNSPTAFADVHRAIRLAAVKLGWRILEDNNDEMLLIFEKGRHFAQVQIQHTEDSVSMLPDDYNVRTKKYNQWLRNLRHKIAIQLELIGQDVER